MSDAAPVIVPIWGCNLGDTLWTTPLTRYIPEGLTIQMLGHDARSRATAPILEGLPCEVAFVEKTTETPKALIRAHVTQQILSAYGHGGKPSIPRVVLKPSEVMWAIEYLRSKGISDPRNAIVFVNHNSGTKDPLNHRAHYVRPHPEIMGILARFWRKGGRGQIVQFGPEVGFYDGGRDPFDPIPDAIHIRGLSVRQLAACYHVIGRMVGGDTGDYWLMLAVGGRVACLVPPDSQQWGYRHWDLLLDETCWGEERPRVRYTLHQNWQRFMNTELFSDAMVDMADPRKLS